MRKYLLIIFGLMMCAAPAWGQSTTVSGQVTDAGAQTWNNGTVTATFVPNPLYPTLPQYTWTGGALNLTLSGTLNATGGYSISIPSNTAITPVNSFWQFKFCPLASSPCFSTGNTTVTGATQTVNATPPAISITPGPGASAYADTEVTGAVAGSIYFNTTNNVTRTCTLAPCTANVNWITNGGSYSFPTSVPCAASMTLPFQPGFNVTDFYINLNCNVTSSTISNLSSIPPGGEVVIIMTQGSGGNTFTFPTSFGATATPLVSTAANATSASTWQYCGTVGQGASCPANGWQNQDQGPAGGVQPVLGVTGPPLTGLMARYEILSTDSASALSDTSGNLRNGTGTVGTAPTIGATGGLVCSGSGASTLPAALNSALSIGMYITFTDTANGGFQSPIAGNGNLANSNSIALFLTFGQSMQGTNAGVMWTWGNGGASNITYQGFYGTNDIIFTMAATDHVYNGGVEDSYFVTGTSAGKQTVGFYQMCGTAAGSGQGSASYASTGMTIWKMYFYDHVLSSTERAQLHTWFASLGSASGNPSTLLSGRTGSQLHLNADSITAGTGLNTPWPNTVTLNNSYSIVNRGRTGTTIQNEVVNQPFTAGFDYVPSGQDNLMVLWLGTNDCANGRTGTQIMQDLSNQIHYWSSLGGRTILTTMISRGGGNDPCKDSLGPLLRTNWRQMGAIGLADPGGDVLLGADGANGSTNCFNVDLIHPNQGCSYNNETPIMQRAINRANGNLDFSTAATYASAAAAAVATTAGSESTNTVTITFGATPANCQVGNPILIAGTTPAGYSNATAGNPESWTILTRSATQITYYTNTTGLGAITVQGTGVCPQQQDADVNYIVNFGAGNTTLQPCTGYTGQNIGIKNINAAGSTIVPWNAAQTIDGAANLAIAAGATVYLQSTLISVSAAGCTWRKIQNN